MENNTNEKKEIPVKNRDDIYAELMAWIDAVEVPPTGEALFVRKD